MAAHKPISPSTAILVLASESPKKQLIGRTRVQKLLYFLRERLPIAASYTPYYYGPYSQEVTASLESLVARGLLDEQVEPVPASEGPFEGRLYKYLLTEDGEDVLDSLRSQHRDEVERLKKAASKVLKRNPTTTTLAVASKLHYIVKNAGAPVRKADLPKKAKSFGWRMDSGEIDNGVKFLLDMDLVSTSS